MTVKFRSSSTLAALERPAPDIPVTTSTCGRESKGVLVGLVNSSPSRRPSSYSLESSPLTRNPLDSRV